MEHGTNEYGGKKAIRICLKCMAAPGNILGQIGESFETIAQDIAGEVKQAPKDMVGSALESVGLSTGGKKNPKRPQPAGGSGESGEEGMPTASAEPSEEVKRAIARAALEELSGKKPREKEQSVWEKLQQEEQQKKEMEKKRKEQSRQALPKSVAKRPRGDLYGVKAKKTAAENRNVRQD